MCGIFGIYGYAEAANLTYLGLYALQHRGQESAGIVSSDGMLLHSHRQMGLVADVFKENVIKRLKGNKAIGHVRYSTTGSSLLKNAQPLLVSYSGGSVAVAHNGNLVNAQEIRDNLEASGSIFQSNTDTEVIIHLLARSKYNSFKDRITDALSEARGAYSLLFLTENKLIAARDPYGFRPLVMGELNKGVVFASETCALDLIEAQYIREVEPGEIIVVSDGDLYSLKPFPPMPKKQCVFEYIYFSRPDSIIFGRSVYAIRKEMGKELARNHLVDADIVIPVPDSGVPAAVGYAQQSSIPFELGMIRNHYVGRTFIEPQQSIRHFGVKLKLNVVADYLMGKKVVVVDDSIVRGTTSRKIVKMIRGAGAKEVHLRIASPPNTYPCYYGVDTPTRKELIASSHTVEEINRYITSDSLAYLTLEGMKKCVNNESWEFCDACFTGKYPLKFEPTTKAFQLSLFEGKGSGLDISHKRLGKV